MAESHPASPISAMKALHGLLLEMFTADEFRRWLRQGTNADILSELPGKPASDAALFEEALLALERRGRIGASFFLQLLDVRPRKKAEITASADMWTATHRTFHVQSHFRPRIWTLISGAVLGTAAVAVGAAMAPTIATSDPSDKTITNVPPPAGNCDAKDFISRQQLEAGYVAISTLTEACSAHRPKAVQELTESLLSILGRDANRPERVQCEPKMRAPDLRAELIDYLMSKDQLLRARVFTTYAKCAARGDDVFLIITTIDKASEPTENYPAIASSIGSIFYMTKPSAHVTKNELSDRARARYDEEDRKYADDVSYFISKRNLPEELTELIARHIRQNL
jgi:hypothetical protein